MSLYNEIEKTFPVLEKIFSEKELLRFKNTQIYDLSLYHFGIGTWIRNNLLHSNNSKLLDLFIEQGIYHKDDMSSIIIREFHQYLSRNI